MKSLPKLHGYFVDLNTYEVPTLWRRTTSDPVAVLTAGQVADPTVWDLLVAATAHSDVPMAVCPVDREPLVGTFEFRSYEFICVVCDRKYGWLDPAKALVTPMLRARQQELEEKYRADRDARKEAAR